MKQEFHSYTKREGDIQESIDVNKFIQVWEWLEKQSYEFQAMGEKHDLVNFPKDISFMIASDSMSKDMQAYIVKINNGVTK